MGGSTTNQVTRNSPAFHTAGHIRLWKTSVLGNFDPHIFLILMSVIVVAGISFFGYFTAKRRQEEKKVLENKVHTLMDHLQHSDLLNILHHLLVLHRLN